MKPRALVVDDDDGVRFTLRSILKKADLHVDEVPSGEAALEKLDADEFHLVITDLRMPGIDGIQLLRRIRERPKAPRVILITAHGSERHAVEAMKLGAYDYFRKPFEIDELLAVVQRAVESIRLTNENERLASEANLARFLVFESPAMSRLAVLVNRVAPRDVTVLITGESGTGKERVAEALVRASMRARRPFVRFNCAALTADLAEAELFGHAKGAFTGAARSRPGLFREADGGTLLLDEVGELDAKIQAGLLRVLQEGEVRPVGEERPIPGRRARSWPRPTATCPPWSGEGALPRGPLLPAQGGRAAHPAPARAPRGHPGAVPALPRPLHQTIRHGCSSSASGAARTSAGLRVARQRARA